MKIATFNVNGVNGRLERLLEWLAEAQPDVACLQELKAPDEKFPARAIEKAGYGAIWHGQARWNGVALLARGCQPVETRRGFVLHSADFFIENSTLPIDDGICLTATLDILKAIARGKGPESAVLALGYAGWSAGQLETEIQANGWLNCPADPTIVFHSALDSKYDLALRRIGIDQAMLSSESGRA